MSHEFNRLYDDLAAAWEAHQALRLSNAPVPSLASSSARLSDARTEMWRWHKANR